MTFFAYFFIVIHEHTIYAQRFTLHLIKCMCGAVEFYNGKITSHKFIARYAKYFFSVWFCFC